MSAPKQRLTMATAEQFDGLTLMRLRVENSRRVRLVDISIDQPLTLIGGDNAQGKSSLLDGLVMCVGDKKVIKAITLNPIHDGQQTGLLIADFGDGKDVKVSITKTLKRVGDDDFTTEIEVDIPGHIPPSRIQDFLDSLAGELAFDPLAFDEMGEAQQFEALRKFVPDFDFSDNHARHEAVFKKRTDVNRDMNKARAAAAVIKVSDEPPCDRVDEIELTAKLRAAGDHNAAIERRSANRANALKQIEQSGKAAEAALAAIEPALQAKRAAHETLVADLERQIAALRARITAADEQLIADSKQITERGQAEASEHRQQAAELQARLNGAEPLPEPIDTAALAEQLNAARESNRAFDAWEAQRNRKAEHEAEADRLAEQSDALTAEIAELQAERQKAIRLAHLPIDGLGFGDGYVTLNDARWQDASTAERVDASTAIAMALNPRMRVILIRNGSNLGTKMRERIRQRAAERGYRVLMEIVDDTGANSHVFIEDGQVKAIQRKADAA